MPAEFVTPWEAPEWDDYVDSHPAARVYHTSAWVRIVSEIGGYPPACAVNRESDGSVTGVLPAMVIRSRLTGNRMGCLPFSDECFPLADNSTTAAAMIQLCERRRLEERLSFLELRGAPALRSDSGDNAAVELGFAHQDHFENYLLSLEGDADAVFRKLHKKSVRPTIKRAFKLGVTVRRAQDDADVREFYRMYCITRRRHGVPPQPIALFRRIMTRLDKDPEAILYLAEHDGRGIGASLVIRHRGVTYLKYEVGDDNYRDMRPVYAMLWRSIEEAVARGDHTYDFGRTEKENTGLAAFKSRWGTERIDLPYYTSAGGDALSTVDSSSLKYRLFTATFRHLPISLSVRIGERIFRHFG